MFGQLHQLRADGGKLNIRQEGFVGETVGREVLSELPQIICEPHADFGHAAHLEKPDQTCIHCRVETLQGKMKHDRHTEGGTGRGGGREELEVNSGGSTGMRSSVA